MKKCKRCKAEVLIWYYYSHEVGHDSETDINMDVLDGPYCLHCVVDMPAPQSSLER